MTIFQAMFLGLIQGLTEYLPVSSSAHLVIAPALLGWQIPKEESFIFDVVVQLGTLLGVLFYFFDPLKNVAYSCCLGIINRDPFHNEDSRLGFLVAIASIPAAILGLLFKEQIASLFTSPKISAMFLVITGLILLLAELFKRPREKEISKKEALIIGAMQSLALIPGISRSGSTIAAGMFCGLPRDKASKFAFFMAIPVMCGASAIAMKDMLSNEALFEKLLTPLMAGFFTAAVTGFLVIKWFMSYVRERGLWAFALYCLTFGFFGSIYFYLN